MLTTINRDALVVAPKKAFIDKLNSVFTDEQIDLKDPMEHENMSIYLLPERESTEASLKYVKINYREYFTEELQAWSTDEDIWNEDLTWELFNKWFSISIQSMIYDTIDEKILKEEL